MRTAIQLYTLRDLDELEDPHRLIDACEAVDSVRSD
jgi:hypothetical protein